jgi:cell division septal protein FtsQ
MSFNRTKVDYNQSAKEDLAAPTPQKDPRMRYAHYRADKPVRVFDELEGTRFKDKHQINEPLTGAGLLSRETGPRARRAGVGAGVGAGAEVDAGERADAEGYSSAPMTVREHRKMRQAAARRASKVPGRVLIVALSLLVLVGAAVGTYQSPLFTVQEVRVEGAERLTSERLTELAAVAEGSTLLRLDVEEIRKRVAADPWVASVEVKRSFPATVVLAVTERKIAAVVAVPSLREGSAAQNWLLSKDGIWLASFAASTALVPATAEVTQGAEGTQGEASEGVEENADATGSADATSGAEGSTSAEGSTGTAEAEGASAGAGAGSEGTSAAGGVVQAVTEQPEADASESLDDSTTPTAAASGQSVLEGVQLTTAELEHIPLVRDISRSVSPEVGASAADEGLLNALAIINGFSPEMLALVRSISAPDRVKTTLDLANNVGVAFGAAEDVTVKEQVILGLLTEHEGKIAYINVRVADRATYRATT